MTVRGRQASFHSGDGRKLGVHKTQTSFLSPLLFPRMQAGAGQAGAPLHLAAVAQGAHDV